jgi:hypothetical protein
MQSVREMANGRSLRAIGPPLGVWVVREVARKAMRSHPARFASLGEAMAEMEKRDQDACLPISDARMAGYWQRRCR